MLVDFNIENFRSVGGQVTLSMERIKLLREKGIDEFNIIETGVDHLHLLKSMAVYGANASGKSNVLSAFSYMKFLVTNSAKESQKGEPIPHEPFAFAPKSSTKPTILEVKFIIDDRLYRYGFELTRDAFEAEWLFCDEKELFTREGPEIACTKRFPEGDGLEKRTRGNSLFLSVCAQWDGEISGKILEGFFGKLHILRNHSDMYPGSTISMLEDEEQRSLIIGALKAADVGISDVVTSEKNLLEELAKLPEEAQEAIRKRIAKDTDGRDLEELVISEISIHHGSADRSLPLSEESEGTRKLFALLGPVISSVENGDILVVDEFNDRLHPLLARILVKMFHSKVNSKAQLIFATHDTNMLTQELFRRDQIWFTEKNKKLETDLYSLAEYRLPDGGKVRQDASYAKDYLKGRYGAVPYFGHFPFIEDDD